MAWDSSPAATSSRPPASWPAPRWRARWSAPTRRRPRTGSRSSSPRTTRASNITTGLTTAGADAATGLQAFKVVAPNFDNGITGEAKDYGVIGTGAGGVLGLGAVGGVFSGSVVAINLDPQNTPRRAPTGEAFKGDLAVDLNGVLWLCVADGTPGTWDQALRARAAEHCNKQDIAHNLGLDRERRRVECEGCERGLRRVRKRKSFTESPA